MPRACRSGRAKKVLQANATALELARKSRAFDREARKLIGST